MPARRPVIRDTQVLSASQISCISLSGVERRDILDPNVHNLRLQAVQVLEMGIDFILICNDRESFAP